MKFSQLTTLANILNTAYIAVLQSGKVYKITFQNFLSNFYNKDEIDTKLANITAGSAPFTIKELGPYSIDAEGQRIVTHSLNNEFAVYWVFEWSVSQNAYLQRQTNIAEGDRDANSVTFVSNRAIDQFKVVFIG